MGKRKRNNNKPTSLEKKGENTDWSFKRLGGEPPPATPGRREGETVIYSPEQTERYQSQWVRYEKALAIAARGPDAIKNGVYYYRAANRPYPETRRLKGIDDWWPTRPPLTPIDEYGDPIFGNFNDDGELSDPYSDPYSNDELLPPGSPNNGGMEGLKPNGFGDGMGTPESIQPPSGGGAYSRSPDEFWRVTPGGESWIVGGGGWIETGDDSFSNDGSGGGGGGTLKITGYPGPWSGGQCECIQYTFTAKARTETCPDGIKGILDGGANAAYGPLAISIRRDNGCDGFQVVIIGRDFNCNPAIVGSFGATPGFKLLGAFLENVQRVDGQPDGCGDPPLMYVEEI